MPGDYVAGNQIITQTAGRDIIGRDQILGYTAAQVSALLDQIRSTFQPKPFEGQSPYPGLSAFQEEDAARFFGREALVAQLAARVAASRFITIAGPSGCGKSSLVRAGLLLVSPRPRPAGRPARR